MGDPVGRRLSGGAARGFDMMLATRGPDTTSGACASESTSLDCAFACRLAPRWCERRGSRRKEVCCWRHHRRTLVTASVMFMNMLAVRGAELAVEGSHFDCSIGRHVAGWSEEKQRYCCEMKGLGCSDMGPVEHTTATVETTTADPEASMDHAEALVSALEDEESRVETTEAAAELLSVRAKEAMAKVKTSTGASHESTEAMERLKEMQTEELEAAERLQEVEDEIQRRTHRHAPEPGSEETSEEGDEKKGEEEESEGEEAEAGEEEYTPVDLAIALMLLGFITFIMVLFTVVNHHDDDMQFYAWSVISQTISIFVAVLMFSSMNAFLHAVIEDRLGAYRGAHVMGDFIQVAVYFTTMQVSILHTSGAREERPFAYGRTTWRGYEKVELSVIEQKERKERQSKCWALLLSHTTGFANINFGSAMQHGSFFREHPPATFLVVPVMYAFHLGIGGIVKRWRQRFIKKYDPEGKYQSVGTGAAKTYSTGWLEEDMVQRGRLYALKMWDETVIEAMNDVASLSISFLTVQACRFNVSGVLPDKLGLELTDYRHDFRCSVQLFCLALLFAAFTVVFVAVGEDTVDRCVQTEAMRHFVLRLITVMRSSSGTSFAWCLLYTCKWEIARVAPTIHGLSPELSNPNSICAEVTLALIISAMAFVLIRLMDILADQSFTGDMADEALITLIISLSILVGFSWEQSFDGGVEVLASLTPRPITSSLLIATAVSSLVIAPWRKYILQKVIRLNTEREEKAEREAQKEAMLNDGLE